MDVRRAFITGGKYSRSQTFEKSHQNETVLLLPVDLSSLPSSFDLRLASGILHFRMIVFGDPARTDSSIKSQ